MKKKRKAGGNTVRAFPLKFRDQEWTFALKRDFSSYLKGKE